jgi:C1A family cysteine protease
MPVSTVTPLGHGLGWKRDLPDPRDRYKFMAAPPGGLPDHTDLRKVFAFNPYNQGNLGSCTGQGIAGLLQFRMGVLKAARVFTPSRLAIYYHERFLESSIPYDNGAMIRSGIESLRKWGHFPEDMWPYDVARFRNRPPLTTYSVAAKLRVSDYYRVQQTHDQIVAHLAASEPVVYGFSVYSNLETEAVSRTGAVPMPAGQQLGGHCVVLWGHDDKSESYLFRNSWSTRWGLSGYGTMPFRYVHDANLCSDFWSIRFMPTLAA